MNYLGGKVRLAKSIAACMLDMAPDRGLYVEPFMGGASVAAEMAPHFEEVRLYDVHPDLVLLWQAAVAGWTPPCHAIDEELYNALRDAAPSALRGFVGFGCSFGARWFTSFAGRYPGHNSPEMSANSLRRRAAQLDSAAIERASFFDLDPEPGAVVYLDPPYRGARGYDGTASFDHGRFWRRAEQWALAGASVFVSEHEAPGAWHSVWAQAVSSRLQGGESKRARVERVFAHISMVRSRSLVGPIAELRQGSLF